jgi:hypothetical protein
VAGLIVASVGWSLLALAATVSTHAFGRYELLLQEGVPVAAGELVGMVRRPTGLPEYPLALSHQRGVLTLNLLGPGHRPHPLATATWRRPTIRGAATRFIVERAVREGATLALQVRQAGRTGAVRLVVDLRRVERMLEGER